MERDKGAGARENRKILVILAGLEGRGGVMKGLGLRCF